jgi:hypothetical protein
MIAAAYPIERRRVQDVSPLVEKRSVVNPIWRYFAVAMEFAPNDSQIPLGPAAVVPERLNGCGACLIKIWCWQRLTDRRHHGDGTYAGAEINLVTPEVIVIGICAGVLRW